MTTNKPKPAKKRIKKATPMHSLATYRHKRDFKKTTEPKGKIHRCPSQLFVIQKHAASHLHYDFRIELNGVLKSWAVPKGPCFDPTIKRLAMHVEDHPLEYGTFEGIIPKGQYGGGTVMLWDKGVWEPLDQNPNLAYQKGHLRFKIIGEKLHGRWDLIRFKDEKHWFLIKYDDEYALPLKTFDVTTALPTSVLSGQNLQSLSENYEKIWRSSRAEVITSQKKRQAKPTPAILLPEGLATSSFPDFIAPELATLVDKPPQGDQWAHEIKFDGYRILAFKENGQITLKSRNNNDWTDDLPSIAKAVAKLPFAQFIIDGEVVALDAEGRSDFQLLQNALKRKSTDLHFFLFDILFFEGKDLKPLPLIERKAILKNLLNVNIPELHYSDHLIKNGNELFAHSCAYALEGIVSKRIDAPYRSKRTKDWLKIKCLKRQEFVIGGYTSPQKNRAHFGALFLGFYDAEGILHYAGNVGTGFTKETLSDLKKRFNKTSSQSNPFSTNPPGVKTAHWVKPTIVCEIEFTEWTKRDHLRHPSFKGLRLDKKAGDVIKEIVTPLSAIKKPPRKKLPASMTLSHPEKVLYPEDNITKADLLHYYETVSTYMLPHIVLRPLTLLRCPSHYQKCFYQRHYNQTTRSPLFPVENEGDNKHEKYIYLNDKEGLLSLVQMGVLEIHPWGSQITHLEYPDRIIFDLDPAPDVTLSQVIEAAFEVKNELAQYDLSSFVKSTGGKGLHVVVPIEPEYGWDDVKTFSHTFVQYLVSLKPDAYVSKMTKSLRKGKIFIDYLRNQRTATAISAYSTRARLHAPVSVPLTWEELKRFKENYTIKTLPQRLKKLKSDPWEAFWTTKQSLKLDQL